MVKNLPANAGDMGSIPDPGRSHISWSNYAHVPQLLSLCPRARGLQLLSPCTVESVLQNKRSCCGEAQAPQLETRESLRSNEDPAQPKNK